MSELSVFVQENGQWLLAGVAIALLLAVLVNQVRILGRTKKLQKNIDGIMEKVGAHLALAMKPDAEKPAAEAGDVQTELKKNGRSEEDDSRLISAVLQEIFP